MNEVRAIAERTGARAPAAPGMLLAAEAVSLSFGGVQAIRDVSFDIHRGEIRSIIGPNGAGKTSMLNVINGFYKPQSGTITFKGKSHHTMEPHEAAASGKTSGSAKLGKSGSTRLEGIRDTLTLQQRADNIVMLYHMRLK